MNQNMMKDDEIKIDPKRANRFVDDGMKYMSFVDSDGRKISPEELVKNPPPKKETMK
jgi:hypothetical protein